MTSLCTVLRLISLYCAQTSSQHRSAYNHWLLPLNHINLMSKVVHMDSCSRLYVAAVSSQPTPKVGRGAGPTPSRFGGASAAPPVPRPAAVDTAQLVAEPGVGSLLFTHWSAIPLATDCVEHSSAPSCMILCVTSQSSHQPDTTRLKFAPSCRLQFPCAIGLCAASVRM